MNPITNDGWNGILLHAYKELLRIMQVKYESSVRIFATIAFTRYRLITFLTMKNRKNKLRDRYESKHGELDNMIDTGKNLSLLDTLDGRRA